MKRIIYTRPDGGLSVCTPAQGGRLAFWITLADGTVIDARDPVQRATKQNPPAVPVDSLLRRWPVEGAVAEWAETEDEWVARIAAKDVPKDATDVQIVDESAIPTDRTFRNGWKAGMGKVEHDMPKCREIHKDRLRELRAPKLAALDVEYMRALEAGDSALAADIAAQKQVLRDVTKDPAITAAKTVDELKAAVPAVMRA